MRDRDEQREAEVRAEWAVPDGVTLAPEVALDAQDPASLGEGLRRRCVAERKAGGRCKVNAMGDGLLCPAHAGRLDSAAGGRARAAASLAVREEARERVIIAEMGARAVIRQTILDHANELRETVAGLARDASTGDRRAQALLVQYLDQGFGKAAVQAGQETPPDSTEGLHTLSDDDLRKLAFSESYPV